MDRSPVKGLSFARLGQEDSMNTLCRMVSNTHYEDLPGDVVRFAKHSILDTIAVMTAGSAMEGVPALVAYVREKGGKPECLIPFYDGKVPSSEAALVLGTMARAADLGQVHEEAAHNSEYIVPVLLAATGLKGKVSGKEFITSFVVGQEVLIRVGMAFKTISRAVPLGRGGGHYIFGAVAGVGKLLGLTTEELENAEGIARGKTQPHDIAMTSPATLMIRVHHGFICRDAIECCLLARRGITGPRQEVLDGPRGYLQLAKWETDPGALTEALGQRWEMLNVMTKFFASCKGTHTSAAGIIEQMEQYNFRADEVERIELDESAINWQLTCIPKEVKWNPRTVADYQFSLPYVAATAAYDRKVFLDSFAQEAMDRKDVRALMTRISATLDTNLPPWAARITTTLKNGSKYSEEYLNIKGHPENPATEKELVDKFFHCLPYAARTLSQKQADSMLQSLLNLENVEDVANALVLPLTPKKGEAV
jgi:2-methylcitrate dehydratase PrpD